MLFKILHGDKSRISTDITPYHEGYCYVTNSGDFYVDMNNERVKLNAKDAETLTGMTFDEIRKSISWNDLLDKPFGIEEDVESTLIVNNQVITASADKTCLNENGRSASWNYIASNNVLTAGKQYRVTINDTQYVGTAVDGKEFSPWGYSGGAVIPLVDNSGNEVGHIGDVVGAGYNNYCYYDGGETGISYVITFEEIIYTEIVRTLDEQYIPNTISRTDHIHSWDELNDKPFGETYNYSATIVDNLSFECETLTFGGQYQYTYVNDIPNVDKPFYVVFDGVEYPNLTSYLVFGDPMIGNHYLYLKYIEGAPDSALTDIVDSGEPFAIKFNTDEQLMIVYTADDSVPHNITVKQGDLLVKTLDEKYIPDTIARVEDIPEVFSGSWNDLTDRPFYKEPGEYITVIEEQTVTNGTTVTGEALRTGKEYIMTVNGVDYTCKSSYLIESGTTYISTSDPYVMVKSKNGLTVETSEDSVVLSVKTKGEDTIVTIPDEYLPSTLVKSIDGVLPNSNGMVRLLESKSFYIDRDYTGTSMRDILNELSTENYRCKGYVYNDLQENYHDYSGLVIYADTYGGADYTHRFILLNKLGGIKVFLVDTDADTINVIGGIGAVEVQGDLASITYVDDQLLSIMNNLPKSDWTQTDENAIDYIQNKPIIPDGIYIQDSEPLNASNGDIWIDTSADATVINGLPEVTTDDDGKILKVMDGAWEVVEDSGAGASCTIVIGTSASGHTEDDCDYLCDGTDDNIEIQAAINSIPAGTAQRIVFLTGSYCLSTDINIGTDTTEDIHINRNIELYGSGGVEIYSPNYSANLNHFKIIINKNNVSFKHIQFNGCVIDCNSGSTAMDGRILEIDSCTFYAEQANVVQYNGSVRINNCMFNVSDGVLSENQYIIAPKNSTVLCSHVEITHNRLHGGGINADSAHSICVEYNYINCSGIETAINVNGSSNIKASILCNYIYNARKGISANSSAVISGNNMINIYEIGIFTDTSDHRVLSNSISFSSSTEYTTIGIFAWCSPSGLFISGNDIGGDIGIHLVSYQNGIYNEKYIVNNIVSNNMIVSDSIGIRLFGGTWTSGSTTGTYTSKYLLINGNNIVGCADAGIEISNAFYECTIVNNVCRGCSIVDNGTDNIVANNYPDGYTAISYGTEDLVDGTSTLETGKLHVVYE